MIVSSASPIRVSSRASDGMISVVLAAVAVLCIALGAAAPAGAVAPAANWTIHSSAAPSSFSAGDNATCNERFRCDTYEVTVREAGSLSMDSSPVVITDTLPAGVTAKSVEFFSSALSSVSNGGRPTVDLAKYGELCTTTPVRCERPTGELGAFELLFRPAEPFETLRMYVHVLVSPGTPGPLTNTATVSGGGAPAVTATSENPVDSNPPFGISGLTSLIAGSDGAPDTQAGDHPFGYTTRIDLNSAFEIGPVDDLEVASVKDLKDVVVDLPLGFLGTALATPKCTLAQLSAGEAGAGGASGCPPDTRIGNVLALPEGTALENDGLYNMVPEHGVAAEFGFADIAAGVHALYASVVRTPQGYVLRTIAPGTPQISLTDIETTLYGDPAATDGSGNTPVALFTNPADCSGQLLTTSIHMDSWQNPGRYNADGSPDFSDPAWASATSEAPPVTGCNLLHFEPSLSVQPETTAADAPTGLSLEVSVPQHEEPGSLATPPLRDATVTLPAGLTINPSAASGLGACSEAQIGLGSNSQPACPESSKIGTLEVSTPQLEGVLTGSIYLATQDANPFHTLLAGYLVIDDPATGVVIKVPGSLTPDPGTGQITGSFKENPQFPFSDLKLHFFGGSRGELATPSGCGTYTTTSDLMPWSAPDSGPDATPSDSFPIDTGCTNAFAPGFTAGAENPQAGGFSPFVLSISRQDGEQGLSGVSLTLPPGLLGKIAGIPLCPEANASAGTCPDASRVGSVTAGAGVGPNPFFVSGQAYLTGPYNGGPYGLVEEVPAVAGPFNLGMVVVRQSLRIDPHTAQVSAVSDPLPRILQGIPLRVRRVDVTLDRPGFTFNPTNCTPMTVTGSVTSTQGATASVSSRFQAGGCRELAFKPSFKVSTQANTSKKQGASLDVKVGYPSGPQANIGKVAVSLPKQLPARLTTIQQACLAATFNANPAACPVGSNIGTATASTPVLSIPLSGPAYLVSHGGAAFPDLILVLQGGGVTLDLVGSINIKHGVTSSAFDSVPDAPISSFELKLPEGPHSGLAAVVPAKAKGNLCGQNLTMPTTLTGQNGAQIKQTTKIAVTGCAKTKKATQRAHGKAKKHTQRAHGKKGKGKKGK